MSSRFSRYVQFTSKLSKYGCSNTDRSDSYSLKKTQFRCLDGPGNTMSLLQNSDMLGPPAISRNLPQSPAISRLHRRVQSCDKASI